MAAASKMSDAPREGLANLFETVTQLFSSMDMLAQPRALVEHLQQLSVVWAVVFIVVGMLCLLGGGKHYKSVSVVLAFLIGLFVGYWLDKRIGTPYVVAGSLAVLLAVAAYPMMRHTVAVFGGLAGAFVGANLWVGLSHALNKGAGTQMPADAYWVGAVIGLIICGMLAFSVFQFSCVLFTSVTGATIAMLGLFCLLLSFEPMQAGIASGLTANQIVVPLLVFVPALIGLILQQSWAMPMPAGKPEAKKA